MKLAHRFARWCDARVRDAFVRGSSAGSTHCSPKQWGWPWRWIRCGPIWAHAKKILKADFGGPCLEDMEQRFCAGHVSEWRHLPQWAIHGQKMPLIEARSDAKKHFNVPEALKYVLVCQTTFFATLPRRWPPAAVCNVARNYGHWPLELRFLCAGLLSKCIWRVQEGIVLSRSFRAYDVSAR